GPSPPGDGEDASAVPRRIGLACRAGRNFERSVGRRASELRSRQHGSGSHCPMGQLKMPDSGLTRLRVSGRNRDLTSFGGGWQVRDRLLKAVKALPRITVLRNQSVFVVDDDLGMLKGLTRL